jgi:tetratricopeptide (TPR) repeat protein
VAQGGGIRRALTHEIGSSALVRRVAGQRRWFGRHFGSVTVLPLEESTSVRPFVGRRQELRELTSALGDAAIGRGSLVLLGGEPGIGKTRLIGELAAVASEREVRVVAARCWEEGGAPPYWPWIQVVRAAGGELEQLAALGGSGVAPEGERIRLFDEVARFLVAVTAADRPLLVTLDDVHAADEPSLLLLRFLAQALADARVMLFASYREGERRVRERGDVFAELARFGRRLSLRGLTPADIEAYVATVTGSSPPPQLVARLHEITGGNPFFVEQVVRLLVAEGLDATSTDPFRRIPEEVRTLIRRRVAGLTRESVTILRVAAVIGREFDLHLLERMSRLSPARLITALGEAAAVGVVSELASTPGRYAFAHELMRETLYDDLPPSRRLELHQKIARVLESVWADDIDPHLSEIARHFYLAAPLGDSDKALEYVVRAGDAARVLLAYEEAAVHYRRALELLPRATGASGARRSELLLQLGDAQWRGGNGSDARATFEEAIADGRRAGDGELLARAALGYVTALGGFLLYARFEVGASGVGLLQEALAALPTEDSALRTRLLAHLALEMWSANEPVDRRVAVSEEALEMARRVDDSEALVTALHARHWALTTPGMTFERLGHSEEMLRIARETVDPELEFLAHNARFHCFLELSDRHGMDAEGQAMTELAERLRQPFYRWHTACLRALRATVDGRFADAERLAQGALELSGLRTNEFAAYVYRYAQRFTIRWSQGRLGELWPEIRDHAERYPWIPRWRDALAAVELSDATSARQELERFAARDFADLPRDGLWLLHMCALAEACCLVGDERRALVLYELLLPHADDNAVSYTQQPFGPVAYRLGKLAALLGRNREADRHFGAALARCELLGSRAIRARILFEYAEALEQRGETADRIRIDAMREQSERLCAELGIERRLPEPVVSAAAFRREGDFWTIVWDGTTFRLRDVKGLGYIAKLLQSPGQDLHVLELVGAPVEPSAGGSPVLDERARAEYERRHAELEDELDEARAWNDVERAARLEGEIDFLTRELTQALGLRGRSRSFGSPAERARISVTKAIRTAIRLIDAHSPELAAHLEAAIQTGRFCSYAPPGAAPPSWSL